MNRQRQSAYKTSRRGAADKGRRTKGNENLPSPAPQLLAFLLFALIAVISISVLADKPELIENEPTDPASLLENPLLGEENEDDSAVLKEGTIEEITHNISSRNAVLIDAVSGRTICEKNSEDVSYPASLTKIMTAIIAIENIPDPDNTMITISQELVDRLVKENSSMAGFAGGDTVTATDLLYGCLLASGGEASETLATYVSGTTEEFVKLMNAKAAEIGCKNTNFVNVTGLHDLKHVSTTVDIAKIFRYALENETFRTIITEAKYNTATEMRPNGITITSTVYSAFTSAGLDMSKTGIVGGKTGYTYEARQCLATYCKKGDDEYILVTFGAGDGSNTTYDNARDAVTIYENYTD